MALSHFFTSLSGFEFNILVSSGVKNQFVG